MTKTTARLIACAILLFFTGAAVFSSAQTYTTLVTFDETDGFSPFAAPVQGPDGSFYGTTSAGGSSSECAIDGSCGTIYKIGPSGAFTLLHSFAGPPAEGVFPYPQLTLGLDGNFYGTTYDGGNNTCDVPGYGCGTVFKVTRSGALTTLYNFCSDLGCSDGQAPDGSLVQAPNGNFYGTTYLGGNNACNGLPGCGTIFQITPSGKLTTLYRFCSKPDCADGQGPQAGLVLGHDGNFYGTTAYGGIYCHNGGSGCGTMFRINPRGDLTTFYSFCAKNNCADGEFPSANLIQGNDGSFYGTTTGGGNRSRFCYSFGCGTIFRVSPSGTLTTLYDFCSLTSNCADGSGPQSSLVHASDGNLYGTTTGAGFVNGTIFRITLDGVLSTLYRFCQQPCSSGWDPWGGVFQATDGNFYGTTNAGGDLSCGVEYGCGTVYRLAINAPSFVSTVPVAAKIGAEVEILGTDLTEASMVTFNGTPAQFTVRLPTLIVACVPAGATTGKVKVTLPNKTLSTKVPFYVLP